LHLQNFTSFPDAVGIDLCVTELLELDEAGGTFEIMMELQVTWFDGTLKTREWESQLKIAEGSILVTSYCAPCIEVCKLTSLNARALCCSLRLS